MEPKKNTISDSEKSPRGAEVVNKTPDNVSLTVGSDVGGKIRETVGELPAETTDATAESQQTRPVTMTVEEKKAILLSGLPKNEKEAELRIKKEITHVVEKKLIMLESSMKSAKNPHKLSLIMREIHHLRGVLAEIANAAFEYLKALWLRLVHGLAL